MISNRPRIRRREASAYLLERHGLPVAYATLEKLASIGGGPAITYFGKVPLYAKTDLDAWAAEKLSKPVASTSERGAA